MRVFYSRNIKSGLVIGADIILEDERIINRGTVITNELVRIIHEALASDTPVFVLDSNELLVLMYTDKKLVVECIKFLIAQFKRLYLSSVANAVSFNTLVSIMQGYLETHLAILTQFISLYDRHLYTFEHSVNVAFISAMIGVNLGISYSDMQDLIVGATLHDLGKVLISPSILNKPSRLNDEEYDSIKMHPIYGVILTDGVDAVNTEIRKIILQHHEKLNGTGYPRGIRAMSDLAKIVSVADIFDALTSIRSYHNARSAKDSIDIILNLANKGEHDKEVVRALEDSIIVYPTNSSIKLSNGMDCVVVKSSLGVNPVVYNEGTARLINLAKEPNIYIT